MLWCHTFLPAGLKYLVNYDTTTFVNDTIRDVLTTLLIAFVLVVVVVFLFSAACARP